MPDDATPGVSDNRFEFTNFFHGHTKGWGVFDDRFGRLRRRFEVEMHGSWQQDMFVLDEHLKYGDGGVEQRTWRVKSMPEGRFEATCPECIGTAQGECLSDTIRMSYAFRLRLPTRVLAVTFDDRIYRMSSRTAVNRATMRKWGIRLGELALFFEKQPAP